MDPASGVLKLTDVQLSSEGSYSCRVTTQGYPPIVSGNAYLYVESAFSI